MPFGEAAALLTFETERALVARAAVAATDGSFAGSRVSRRRMTEPGAPLPSPLLDRHEALGAKIVEFAGWLMPIQYAGIIEEHRAVRSAAGLFDLSHMGELVVEGPEAGAALAGALVTDPPALAVAGRTTR